MLRRTSDLLIRQRSSPISAILQLAIFAEATYDLGTA
jgi:hypothetical protein